MAASTGLRLARTVPAVRYKASRHASRLAIPTSAAVDTLEGLHSTTSLAPSVKERHDHLIISSRQHGLQNIALPYAWLRDACTAPTSVHPSTQQKVFRTSDVPAAIRPATVLLRQDDEHWKLEIVWDCALQPDQVEADRSVFDLAELASHVTPAGYAARNSLQELAPILWKRSSLSDRNLRIPYARLESPPIMLAALRQLITYGIVFFTDVPVEQKADELCELAILSSMLGNIRRTWYGDKVWDVKSVENSKNIAYTNLDLGLHMDLVHYDDPPRYQLLHFLHAAKSLRGGASYFADAYYAAEVLRKTEPEIFATLATEQVAFEYKNGGHWRSSHKPTIELAPPSEFGEEAIIAAVNYSPPFQGRQPWSMFTSGGSTQQEAMERFRRLHHALGRFSSLVESPELQYSLQLAPGECVAFDNRRVLHARTAFSWDAASEPAGEAARWMKGCYVEGDSIRDHYRTLSERLVQDTTML
ncbi:hypothetical protein E5Q_00749 [Mixia osmundae IAM 14324]|uniref:TauD/TfdA-like domain-containing protein n=2 Tax=Mixia osmundae (strain CBS 9802 / IAM 14324 / JCM 22182 / KY 12970) TaxID=764103 RepID=G7DU42_MIXOS|nr:hypothetical protein E5Q_00749 [Mixia osmundae IAM 14324]